MTSNFLPGAIIFDFDGTMVDSETATLRIAMPIISRHLGRKVHEGELEVLKGRVWKEEFRKWFPDSHYDVYNEIVSTWEEADPDIGPYNGISEILRHLFDKQIPMAIASSREGRLVKGTLSKLGWGSYFEAVVGQEDTDRHKPEPHPLLMVSDILGIKPQKCIYIGDQPWDIRASKAACMTSGAALWGEGRFEVLAAESPDFMFHHPLDVIAQFFGL